MAESKRYILYGIFKIDLRLYLQVARYTDMKEMRAVQLEWMSGLCIQPIRILRFLLFKVIDKCSYRTTPMEDLNSEINMNYGQQTFMCPHSEQRRLHVSIRLGLYFSVIKFLGIYLLNV
jgi:hypothetical protein